MKLLKHSFYALALGLTILSCTKEDTSFDYSGMVGLWQMDQVILENVSIPLDHCEEKKLLNIGESTITTITYSGLNCEDLNTKETGYIMNTKAFYLDIPEPEDTTQITIDKITGDEFIIQYKSSDYATPNIIEKHVYKKIKAYPIPLNSIQ